jgi:hypothetical protein
MWRSTHHRCVLGCVLALVKDQVGNAVEITSDQSVWDNWGSVLCEVDQSGLALVKCRRQQI